jgi:hypothetical protein
MKQFNTNLRINDFRFMGGYEKKPDYLEEFGIILGYEIFHSTFNENTYVILDKEDGCYYAFERFPTDDQLRFEFDLRLIIQLFFLGKTDFRFVGSK